MFVKPAEGRAVRDPVSRKLLAAEGEDKPDTSFWHRRVRDNDVEVIEPKAAVEAAPEQPALPAPESATVTEEH